MQKYTKEFIQKYKERFGDNVVAILETGSRFSNKYTEGWSDADYIVVFKKLLSVDLHKIREINKRFEGKYGFHFGTSPITEMEYMTTSTNSLKVLLIKMNLVLGLTHVVYGISLQNIPAPTSFDKCLWLQEINYFKDYLRIGVRDLENIELAKRCIKCAEYLLLAICLYYGYLPKDIEEKIALLSSKLPNVKSDLESLSIIKEMKIEYSKDRYTNESINTVIDSLEELTVEFYRVEKLAI